MEKIGKFLPNQRKIKFKIFWGTQPFFGKKHKAEFKEQLSQQRKGSLNPMFNKPKSKSFLFYAHKPKKGAENWMSKPVILTHQKTKQVLKFNSQIEAALFFGYKTKYVIVKALKNGSLLKNLWKLELSSLFSF